MELHEFIAATLGGIQQGVQSAIDNARTRGLKGAINPVWGTTSDAGQAHVQSVQFDIAITASERNTAEGKGGINVAAIRIGGGGSLTDENSRVSRIQFAIPMIPPVTTVQRADGDDAS